MSDDFNDSDDNYLDVPAKTVNGSLDGVAGNMMEYRKELIKGYHGGSTSLPEKIDKNGKNTNEDMVLALVSELISETDHLLGNELLAGEFGNLRDASVISTKRADVLEKAIKAVQTKLVFDKDYGFDVKSPAMRQIFKFFLGKVKQVFGTLGYDDEASDTFFRTFLTAMDSWEKELQQELEEMTVLEVKRDEDNG